MSLRQRIRTDCPAEKFQQPQVLIDLNSSWQRNFALRKERDQLMKQQPNAQVRHSGRTPSNAVRGSNHGLRSGSSENSAEVPEVPGIYMMWNTRSGQILVGMTSNSLRLRFSQQRQALRRGGVQNRLVGAAVKAHGAESFRFCVLEAHVKRPGVKSVLKKRELWWAKRLGALDEATGLNLEAGGDWSAAARLRDVERKLIKSAEPKYVLLAGISLESAFAPEFLRSWQAGVRRS